MQQRNHSAVLPPRPSADADLVVEVVDDDAAGLGDSPAATDAAGPGDGPAADDGEDYQRRLGQRLRAVRRGQSLRLQDVEQRSAGRFKAVVVGSYERGDRAVSAHKLAALAAFYGVPVSELLPEEAWPSRTAADPAVRIAVYKLRGVSADHDLAPLSRLVQHVQWLRGDYHGSEVALRGEDLRTVAVALGVEPSGLEAWLAERDLLVTS